MFARSAIIHFIMMLTLNYVFLLVHYVSRGMLRANAYHALRAIKYLRENVY